MKKEKIINLFFKEFSVAHAIPRINEALVLTEEIFKKPVLDLGCGDGKFVRFLFGQKGVDVGLDPNDKELEKAINSKAYKKTVKAMGNKMPFKNQSFGSILSNSVLEHVSDLDGVLKEANRVLKKDGLFIFTVPSPKVSDYLFFSKFIPQYALFKEKLWRHVNYFDESKWEKRLNKAGFKIEKIEKTNGEKAIFWADIFFPFFLIGPMSWIKPFLVKQNIFGLDQSGATLVICCRRQK